LKLRFKLYRRLFEGPAAFPFFKTRKRQALRGSLDGLALSPMQLQAAMQEIVAFLQQDLLLRDQPYAN